MADATAGLERGAAETAGWADCPDLAVLEEKLLGLARCPVLLVATDYDGTLSPIVNNPADARPSREAMIAVRNLAQLPNTHAAVVSGRALRELGDLTGSPDGVHLVGSHGSEFDLDFATSLSGDAADLRERLVEELAEIASRHDGCTVETKPASVAFHFRNADEATADKAAAEVRSGPASLEGVYVKPGKLVIERAVVCTRKGSALNLIRRRVGASAIIFLGDDVTDEDGFRTLQGPDLGVKVGFEGETLASVRVAETDDVAKILARLCELRQSWLEGSDAVPIEKHSMLSDQRSIALVTPEARICWFCAPSIDSQPIFSELLGGPTAGYFSVRPTDGGAPLTQDYLGESFSLRTTWNKVTVTDFLDCSGGRVQQRPGRTDLVRVIEGTGRVRIEFAPRLDFGRLHTKLTLRSGGVLVQDSVDPIVLCAPGLSWTLEHESVHDTAVAEVDLSDPAIGGKLVLELRYGTGDLEPAVISTRDRTRQTERFWTTWAGALDLPKVDGLDDELTRRSALVLKALCHGPTGAIAAAGTTSLPECIGGVRNWDYRYCWPRDASMSASALVQLGSTHEALRFLDWLLGVVDDLPSPERLSPIYTMAGRDLPAEGEIGDLAGYAGSRPVRVGNAASRQLQLDVFGPIVELVHLLLKSGAPLSTEHWRLVEAMVGAVDARWKEPDHGIWEIRGPRRHHVHSKVMCWLTAKLGAEIATRHQGRGRPAWEALRDEIAEDVLTNGWDGALGTFTGAYGEHEPDAAVLTIGLYGLIEPTDPRFVATVRAVEETLRRGKTVYRYKMDDGLPGHEGGFNLCTGWLIESLALCGRADEARSLFAEYCGLAGPTGLMAEEYDPDSGLALGNHPQAYSHLALINSAKRLEAL